MLQEKLKGNPGHITRKYIILKCESLKNILEYKILHLKANVIYLNPTKK